MSTVRAGDSEVQGPLQSVPESFYGVRCATRNTFGRAQRYREAAEAKYFKRNDAHRIHSGSP